MLPIQELTQPLFPGEGCCALAWHRSFTVLKAAVGVCGLIHTQPGIHPLLSSIQLTEVPLMPGACVALGVSSCKVVLTALILSCREMAGCRKD